MYGHILRFGAAFSLIWSGRGVKNWFGGTICTCRAA